MITCGGWIIIIIVAVTDLCAARENGGGGLQLLHAMYRYEEKSTAGYWLCRRVWYHHSDFVFKIVFTE